MNVIHQAVQVGEYKRGIEEYEGLSNPTPADMRWVGVCFLQTQQLPEAALRLRQALNQGEVAAGVHLASLLFLQGEVKQASSVLDRLDPGKLDPADAALWYRACTRVRWALGATRTELFTLASQAWNLAAEAPLDVAVSVATLLGHLHNQFQEHKQAIAYLEFAQEHATKGRLGYICLARADALLAVGHVEEARKVLQMSLDERSSLLRRELEARVYWIEGDVPRARQAFLALLPEIQQLPRGEFRVRLQLLTIAALEEDAVQVMRHLLRAERLVQNEADQARLEHRAGLCLKATDPSDAVRRLTQARAFFEAHEFQAETVLIHLALAEAEPSNQAQHLHCAATCAATLPGPLHLEPEWRLLPQVYTALQHYPSESFERLSLLGETFSPVVRLCSLGHALVEVNGLPIRFRLGRVVEILAYLLRRGSASLSEVQRDLFPDVPPLRSKNYFHQVRLDVASRVAGLTIHYDYARRTYTVRTEATLQWDVWELELAQREQHSDRHVWCPAVFLPDAVSDWAQEEQERLTQQTLQLGLTQVQDLLSTCNVELALQVLHHLLDLDTLNEQLHLLRLKVTWETYGEMRALHVYTQSAQLFGREVGEVPCSLKHFTRHWQHTIPLSR